MVEYLRVTSNQNPENGRLRLQFICIDPVLLRPGEIRLIIRHRFILLYAFGLAALLLLANLSGRRADMPLEQRAPIYLGGVFVGLCICGIVLHAVEKLFARRGIALHMSPVFLLSAATGLSVGELMSRALNASQQMTLYESALVTIFYFICTELFGTFAAYFIFPPILSELRGEKITSITDISVRRAAPPMNEPPQNRPQDNQLEIGGRRFDPGAILHVRADGNYVHVTTDDGTQLLPGPFGSVVAAMPKDLGRRIHRSHWVAERAITGYRRDRRDILVTLRDRSEVKVAIPRQQETLSWLQDVLAQKPKADQD
jgi:hypothetical protein